MTARGHYITALSLGLIGTAAIAGDSYSGQWVLVFSDFIKWSMDTMMAGGYFDPPRAVPAMVFLMGCAFGAFAPDWLELSYIKNGLRHSLIPHRGATHGLVFWVLVTGGIYWGLYYTDMWSYIINWFALGFSAACVLHCLIDGLSPSGIPVVPKLRIAVNVYRTGEASELKLIIPIIGSAVGYFFYLA